MSSNRRSPTVGLFFLIIGVMVLFALGAEAQSKFKTLFKFKGGKDGAAPFAGLIFDQAGNLYGTTASGGRTRNCSVDSGGCGVVYKLTQGANGRWTESVLYTFCSLANCADGAEPRAGLIFDGAGNLYGTTYSGGGNGAGTVFKLATNADGSWSESVINNLGGEYGDFPAAGLIFDTAGNLYGTTTGGGSSGTVFKLTPNHDATWTAKTVYTFCSRTNCSDGNSPFADLIFDAAGNLYGTAAEAGDFNCNNLGIGCGVVFQLEQHPDGGWTENVLHTFGGGNGDEPLGRLVFDAAGNLYGTTTLGGKSNCFQGLGCGIAFRLTPHLDGGWMGSVLHRFTGRDGAEPIGGLTFDRAGNLYGTTFIGGECCGVVFKLAPNSMGGWTRTVLHHFLDHPGAESGASMVFDVDGNLYGTTRGDGTTTFGSVFEITP